MQAIVNDNAQYAKVVLACGYRSKIREIDFSQILEDENVEAALKEAAEVSMGTEIADIDVLNIQSLAEQVSRLLFDSKIFRVLIGGGLSKHFSHFPEIWANFQKKNRQFSEI